MDRPPSIILDAAREKRSRLKAELNEAAQKIAALDAFLLSFETPVALDPREDPAFQKKATP